MSSFWIKNKAYKYDYVIVGGGLSGLSIASHLRSHSPKAKIAVLDKNHLFWGASGRNAGFLTSGSISYSSKLFQNNPFVYNLINKNIEFLTSLFNQKSPGSISLAYSPEELNSFISFANQIGCDYKVITKKELYEKGIKAFGGLLKTNEGTLNPLELCSWLKNNAQAEIFEGTEVSSVENNKVQTNRGSFYFDKCFIATNIYSTQFECPKKDMLTYLPARNQILSIKDKSLNFPYTAYSTKHFIYFKKYANQLIIGGGRKEDPDTETTMKLAENPKIINFLLDYAKNHLGIKNPNITKKWSGIMAYTPDENSYLGELDDNIFVMTGLNGHGVGSSYALAKILTDHILKGETLPPSVNVKRMLYKS